MAGSEKVFARATPPSRVKPDISGDVVTYFRVSSIDTRWSMFFWDTNIAAMSRAALNHSINTRSVAAFIRSRFHNSTWS